jgi:hypothetical protein
VLGVYGREAGDFAEWVADITGGEVRARLPLRAELEVPMVRRAVLAHRAGAPFTAWLADRPEQPAQLWVPDGSEHPHLVRADVLAEHLTADLARVGLVFGALHLVAAALMLPRNARAWAQSLVSGMAPEDGDPVDLLAALGSGAAVGSPVDFAVPTGIAHVLDDHLDRARRRFRARARDTGRHSAIDFAQTLNHTIDSLNSQASSRARAADTASVGDSSRALELVRELIKALVHQLDSAQAMAVVNGPARVLALDSVIGQASSVLRGLDAFLRRASVLDEVLTAGYDQVLAAAERAEVVRRSVLFELVDPGQPVDTLLAAAGVAGIDHLVCPDMLAEEVRAGQREWAGAADPPAGGFDLSTAATRLATVALPLVSWQQPVAAELATAVRLGALCLAAAGRDRGDTAARYRRIAAGVTLLERRTDGRAPLNEGIVLTVI